MSITDVTITRAQYKNFSDSQFTSTHALMYLELHQETGDKHFLEKALLELKKVAELQQQQYEMTMAR